MSDESLTTSAPPDSIGAADSPDSAGASAASVTEVVQPDAVTAAGGGEEVADTADAVAPERRESVNEPAKVMRIGSMVKQLLEEVRAASLDEASRERLAEVYERSVVELSDALSPDLQEELRGLALPFDHDEVPSEAELRVAKAQLVGWLEGLFHGIQASVMAQQAAAQAQMQMQQRGLPGGPAGGPPEASGPDAERPGTYL